MTREATEVMDWVRFSTDNPASRVIIWADQAARARSTPTSISRQHLRTFTEGAGYSYFLSMDFGAGRFEYRMGDDEKTQSGRISQGNVTRLTRIHPGFRDSSSTVLHRYGTDPSYQNWRGSIQGQHGSVWIEISQRNPPALFGAGLIDAIPDEVIEGAARRKVPGSAQTSGRVSRLKNGRIGRFGWKAQTATVDEFTRSAAASEIGLEIPGRHQANDPRLPGVAASGLDMDESECQALVEYVKSLPVPVVRKPADPKQSAQVKAGELTFKSIGCTACHLQRLGEVEGIYSDLLLHDMGAASLTRIPIRFSRAILHRPIACRVRTVRPRTGVPLPCASGERHRSGEFATLLRTCMTDEPPPLARQSCFTRARQRHQPDGMQIFLSGASNRSTRFLCRSWHPPMIDEEPHPRLELEYRLTCLIATNP